MTNIAKGQITIINNANEHTFIKYSDDLVTMYTNPSDINDSRYRPVEWIANNYNYIAHLPVTDAGQIGSNTRIVIEFLILDAYSNNIQMQYLFGNYNDNTNFYYLRYNRRYNRLEALISASTENVTAADQSIFIPCEMQTKMKVDMSAERIIVNDTDIYYWSQDRVTTAFSSTYALRFFGATNKTSQVKDYYKSYSRIYSLKVYQNDVLTIDNIPVVDLQEKYTTMYNKVLNQTEWVTHSGVNINNFMSGYEFGENRVLNSNFYDGLNTWSTDGLGDYMTATVVNDVGKGTCVKLISTDTTTIDATHNLFRDSSGYRYMGARDMDNCILSFDAKSDTDESVLEIYKTNGNDKHVKLSEISLSTEWQRFVIQVNKTTNDKYDVGFSPQDANVEYYITNVKV